MNKQKATLYQYRLKSNPYTSKYWIYVHPSGLNIIGPFADVVICANRNTHNSEVDINLFERVTGGAQ